MAFWLCVKHILYTHSQRRQRAGKLANEWGEGLANNSQLFTGKRIDIYI